MNEQLIWSRFKEGSETDYAHLYRLYAPVMFRYGCKLTSDRDMVKDGLQQVFLMLWKGRANLGNPPSVKNYLLKALRCEIFRKTGQKLNHESLPEDYFFEVVSSYETDLIKSESASVIKTRIKAILARLPRRQREVLFLKYYNNLSYPEIADIMNIEQDSVYKLTYKALEKVQRMYLKISAAILLLMLLFQ